MPVSKALARALRWGREELDELADEFLDHKVFTYVETLGDLFREHGAAITDEDIVLSDEILLALKREAIAHAGHVVDTYNGDLEKFLKRNADLQREQLLSTYDAWSADRADARAETIAVTEAYSAHADATIAFYEAQGAGGEYDFGAHVDDDAPACEVCAVLEATNPHPVARVIAVGTPHINCRQNWRRRDVDLPEELFMPSAPAGIVGSEPLVNRHGNDHVAAAAFVAGDAE
jgi:hypothetical protein